MMRKIIFEMAISLDGFIEGPYGELDWLSFDNEVSYAHGFLSDFDTIFYGRVAYEKLGFLHEANPLVSDEESEFIAQVSQMRKFVFSNSVKHVEGNGMVISDKNLIAEVNRIRKEKGKNIWLIGGADIFSSFVNFDLIDEYRFRLQPHVLGSGKPLFKDLDNGLHLKLAGTQCLPSGVVILHYIPSNRQ